jgi:hypothetical protein
MKRTPFFRLKDEVVENKSEEIRKIIDSLNLPENVEDRKFLAERTYRMIEHVMGRVDYYEDLRIRYVNMSITLLLVSLGFITLFHEWFSTLYLLVMPFLWLIMICFIEVYLFLRHQSPSYPYGQFIRDPWFYEYFLSTESCADFRTIWPWKRKQTMRKVMIPVLEDLKKWFKQEWMRETESMLKDDMEYFFLMSAIFANKKRHVRDMSKVMSWGLLIFTSILTIFTLYYLSGWLASLLYVN